MKLIFLLGLVLIGVVGQEFARANITEKQHEERAKINLRTEEYAKALNIPEANDPFNLTETFLKNKQPSKVLQILQESLSLTRLKALASSVKIDTIVLYGCSEVVFKSGQIFNLNHPPLLIKKSEIPKKLKDLFSSHILSIVCLERESLSVEQQFLDQLKLSLEGGHMNKIIFIKEFLNGRARNDVADDELQLFSWLHDNGFWQSLLMDYEGNSLALQHLTGKFVWNLSLEKFLYRSTKWHNLHGFPINCSMAANPPRVYIQYDSQHNVILKGYFGTTVRLFAEHYNASLKPSILSNKDYYNDWDCVKYIQANKVDICANALPMHNQYVITYPNELVASHLMVPYDKPLPKVLYFLKPFQPSVWNIICLSFLYKILTLSLIHRLQHGNWNGSQQMLYALLSVSYLPFQLSRVKGRFRRFLEIIMILVGFVVANWYLSVLSSLLFSRLYFHDVKTLQHLVDHNISIMVDDFEQYMLNASNTDPIIMRQLKVVSNEILLRHRRNLDPHYAYYTQYDKIAFYLHQQEFLLRPRMKVLTDIPPVNEILGGIPMSPKWPFQHLLNIFVRRIWESGLIKRFYAIAMEEGISSGYLHYFPTQYYHVEPLSLEYFQMPAMLLIGGSCLAMGAFLLELIVLKKISNK